MLEQIKKHSVDPISAGFERREHFEVALQPQLETATGNISADRAMVRDLDMNTVGIVSRIMGQTVALDWHNDTVDELLANFSRVNSSVERTGGFSSMERHTLFQVVARNNSLFIDMVSKLGIKDRSDTAWHLSQYEGLHEGMRREFDLDERFTDVEFKLDLIQQNAKFFLEVMHAQKSNSLEWIIIVLISFECVLMILDMSARGKGKGRASTCVVTLLCSLVVTAAFLAIGVLLLAFPSVARKMIYPCLSHIEDGTPSASASPLEGDAVRLAGACFLSVAVSCLGLLMPLLPCCQYEKDDAGNSTLSSHFFLRTLLFIQASMGLALVGIGLVNLTVSEDDHIYDDFGHQAFFDKTNTGDLVSRLTADCGEMAGDLTWFFRFSVEALVRISGISIYMVLRSPVLGLCTLAIVPFVGVINKFYGDWLGKNAQGVQSALAAATTVAHESLASIKTVITLGSEEKECEKYKTHIEKLYDLNIRQLIATGIYFMAVSTFLINTVVQATLLLLGSIFVEQGKLTPEILLAFMLYQGQLQEYTLNLFQSYSSLVKSSGAGDRVFYLLDRHPPPPGTGNLIVQSFETDADEVTTSQDIVLDNVSMGRHLLAFSLVAGSLLVAESLAIHQSPLQQSHGALARFGRRRAPSWRLGAADDHKSSYTVLLASSPSQTSEDSAEIVDVTGHEEEETRIELTSHSTTHEHAAKSASEEEEVLSIWPRMDDLDKRMMKIALPCIANFAINPLIGAVDLFWVNRMGNALAGMFLAGQAAANQVFSSAFWIVSVLPSVTATLVSKANASGNQEELQDAVSQALVVGFYISLAGSLLMLRYPERVLSSVLKVLDPILMFTLAMGVPGAALATLAAEVISAASFLFLMLRRKMIRWSKIFQLPSWTKLKPLLEGGAALQMRNVALNLTFLAVARVTQSLDDTGVAAAAHALAIQCFQVGGIVLLALSVVAQTIVPNELIEKVDASTGKRHGGKRAAKNVVNRLIVDVFRGLQQFITA
ncbi:hypothetical protein ACHAXT_004690 [Thalassiosira profunda]